MNGATSTSEKPSPSSTSTTPTARILTGPVIGLLVVLGLFIILIGIKGELKQFLSLDNVQVIAQEGTIPAVVALGALLVIISGGIDLSVGSVIALVTVVTMQVYRALEQPTQSVVVTSLIAVLAGIAAGGLCGLVNGLV